MEAFKNYGVLCKCWLWRVSFPFWPHRVLREAKSCSHVLTSMDFLGSRVEDRPHGLSAKTRGPYFHEVLQQFFSSELCKDIHSLPPTDTPIFIRKFHVSCLLWIREGNLCIFFL